MEIPKRPPDFVFTEYGQNDSYWFEEMVELTDSPRLGKKVYPLKISQNAVCWKCGNFWQNYSSYKSYLILRAFNKWLFPKGTK